MVEILSFSEGHEPQKPYGYPQPIIVLIETEKSDAEMRVTDEKVALIESLLIVPFDASSHKLREFMRKHGFQTDSLHPRFASSELTYLQAVMLRKVRRLLESRLHELEDRRDISKRRCDELLREMGRVKELLAFYESETSPAEIAEVNDLIDIVISRAMESYPVSVVEVVKIEN